MVDSVVNKSVSFRRTHKRGRTEVWNQEALCEDGTGQVT